MEMGRQVGRVKSVSRWPKAVSDSRAGHTALTLQCPCVFDRVTLTVAMVQWLLPISHWHFSHLGAAAPTPWPHQGVTKGRQFWGRRGRELNQSRADNFRRGGNYAVGRWGMKDKIMNLEWFLKYVTRLSLDYNVCLPLVYKFKCVHFCIYINLKHSISKLTYLFDISFES